MTGAHGRWMRRKSGAAHTPESLRERCEVDDNGCWNWQMSLNTHGYGQVRHLGVSYQAQRLMFILLHPETDLSGKLICHHCDNRKCINPDHLYAGTPLENMQDMERRGRMNRGGRVNGENHPDAKLTDSDIPIIRRRLEGGEVPNAIARSYGISGRAIRSIRNQETWRHIK